MKCKTLSTLFSTWRLLGEALVLLITTMTITFLIFLIKVKDIPPPSKECDFSYYFKQAYISISFQEVMHCSSVDIPYNELFFSLASTRISTESPALWTWPWSRAIGNVPVQGYREEVETGSTISEFIRVEVYTCSKTRLTLVCNQDKIMSSDWVVIVEAGWGCVYCVYNTYLG